MILKSTLISLLLASSFITNAQITTIQGQVVDNKTNQSIPFAHLYLTGTTTGAVSNEEGFFSLTIHKKTQYEVSISSIGYHTKTIKIESDYSEKILKIRLLTSTLLLGEIVIQGESESAEQIVRNAFLKINQNYQLDAHVLTGYLKVSENTNNEPIFFAEANVQGYIPKKGSQEKIKLTQITGRKKNVQGVSEANIEFKGSGYERIDPSIYYGIESMHPEKMEKWKYSIDSYTKFNDRPVVIISFTDSKKRKQTYGKFTIDLNSLAFIRIEGTKIHGDGGPLDNWKWTSKSYIEQYIEGENSKWHLKSSLFLGNWINKKTKKKFQHRSIFVTTKYSNKLNPPSTGETLNIALSLYENIISSDSNAWTEPDYRMEN